MNAFLTSHRNSRSTNDKPSFRAVLIYEDVAAGKRAREMCTQIAEQLGGECRLGNRVWSFDVLAIPEIRNVAASAAAMADLVVVSASGLHDLPDTVTEWVDMWLWLIDQGDPAMVLLLGADTRRGASLRGHLRHAAQQNRVPFFSSTLPLEPPSRSIRRSGLRSGMQSAA